MQAKDIMRRRVITVSPQMSLRDASKLFIERHITGAPVLDPDGRVLGVVSETDLVKHARATAPQEIPIYHREPEEPLRAGGIRYETPDYAKVGDVMTPWVISFEEDTPVRQIASLMLDTWYSFNVQQANPMIRVYQNCKKSS